MGGFVSFATAFCAACIFIGALSAAAPEKAMSKPVKYVLSLAFTAAVIGAAGMIDKTDLDFNEFSGEISVSSDMQTAAAEYAYAYALKSADINFSEITVCTDKTDDGSIIITKVIIYSDGNESEIRRALSTAAENYEVEIKNE